MELLNLRNNNNFRWKEIRRIKKIPNITNNNTDKNSIAKRKKNLILLYVNFVIWLEEIEAK